jgi:hypothetical protein
MGALLACEANEEAQACVPAPPAKSYDLTGVRDPVPFGVFMLAQVPLATYFQALP